MRHRLDRRRIVRRGRRRLEALGQRRMVRLAAHRDRRFDSRLFASLDIARAEIAGVRQQSFGLAQGLGQSANLAQHRLDLVLVIGRLDHLGRHHQRGWADGTAACALDALIEAHRRPPA